MADRVEHAKNKEAHPQALGWLQQGALPMLLFERFSDLGQSLTGSQLLAAPNPIPPPFKAATVINNRKAEGRGLSGKTN